MNHNILYNAQHGKSTIELWFMLQVNEKLHTESWLLYDIQQMRFSWPQTTTKQVKPIIIWTQSLVMNKITVQYYNLISQTAVSTVAGQRQDVMGSCHCFYQFFLTWNFILIHTFFFGLPSNLQNTYIKQNLHQKYLCFNHYDKICTLWRFFHLKLIHIKRDKAAYVPNPVLHTVNLHDGAGRSDYQGCFTETKITHWIKKGTADNKWR